MAAGAQGGRLVTVFGGSGFVGRHTVRALAKRGWRIRAAVRRPDLAGHLQPMGNVGQIQAVQANLRYPVSVARAVAGADAAVNAVGILAPVGHQTFEEVHVEGAHAVAVACREAGVKTLVHLSAIGADAGSSSSYAASKAKGEAHVLEAMPSAVILRPSVIFGPEDELFNRFAAMARRSPALPAVGGGTTRFQPVYVADVASAVAAVLEGAAKGGTVYELGGPEIVSLREILERVASYTGRNAKPFPIPFIAAKVLSLATTLLPGALRPITYDQVKLLERDNVVSDAAKAEGRTLAGLGIAHPTAIEAVVPAYLERFRPRGQYSHYRS
jgi:NADH dehydrogenase